MSTADALMAFIETIEATGGIARLEDGRLVPVADEEWSDLALAYMDACSAMGRIPLISE